MTDSAGRGLAEVHGDRWASVGRICARMVGLADRQELGLCCICLRILEVSVVLCIIEREPDAFQGELLCVLLLGNMLSPHHVCHVVQVLYPRVCTPCKASPVVWLPTRK